MHVSRSSWCELFLSNLWWPRSMFSVCRRSHWKHVWDMCNRILWCTYWYWGNDISDPFCRNETLLCKTWNGDMAENTCWGHFIWFWDFCKIIILYTSFIYTVKVLDWNLKPNGVILMIFGPIGHWPNNKSQTLKADFSISYFTIPQWSNRHHFP